MTLDKLGDIRDIELILCNRDTDKALTAHSSVTSYSLGPFNLRQRIAIDHPLLCSSSFVSRLKKPLSVGVPRSNIPRGSDDVL